MHTHTAWLDPAMSWPIHGALTPHPRAGRRKRRLSIAPATYPEMTIAAHIVRSSAEWYRPLLEPADMSEHDVGQRWIDGNYDRRDFYLGWHGDDPVGMLSTQQAGDAMYLGYVYVHAERTGRGYGRELLEFARARAVACRKKSLVLIAHPRATWATKAYRRFGFAKVADRRDDVLAWNDGWLRPYYEEGFELYEHRLMASGGRSFPRA